MIQQPNAYRGTPRTDSLTQLYTMPERSGHEDEDAKEGPTNYRTNPLLPPKCSNTWTWQSCNSNNDRTESKHLKNIPVIIFLNAVFWIVFVLSPQIIWAGPPFLTDDPEPVAYKHGEAYIACQYRHDRGGDSSTLPHVEINYGVIPNLQIHLIAPLIYVKPEGTSSRYGYGDTELGAKFRFIQETDYMPQVAVFPMIEFPTGDADKNLGNGRTQYFLPVWLQKSLGPWTTYGGAGYWVNPGYGNKDWWQFGWQIQREINKTFTLGAEIYHKTAGTEDGSDATGYTAGAMINLTENHHILLACGQDIRGPNYLSAYIGYQFTFGPLKGQ